MHRIVDGPCPLTQESNLNTLLTFGGLVDAHEAFDFLLDGEFPEGRKARLVAEAQQEVLALPRSPSEEDPDVSSQEQVMNLLRRYTINQPMRLGRDYSACDNKRGLWKWKTRTVRIAGMYYAGPHRFIIARVGFARGLKRHGNSVTEKEAAFAAIAAGRLQALGLLEHAWKTKDPHHGKARAFDIDERW